MLPAKDTTAGWHFINIASNYGAVFEKETDDKYIAAFDSQETIEALELIKDMKHKDDSVLGDATLGYADILKFFALDEVGMVIGAAEDPMINMMINRYNMDINNFSICSVPSGPAGKTSLMGGSVIMFSNKATREEIKAAIEFLRVCGYSPTLDEVSFEGLEEQFRADVKNGNIVLPQNMSVWKNEEREIKENKLRAKYANVKPWYYKEYFENAVQNIMPEPTYNSQELYNELSRMLQKVLSDPNTDIPDTVSKAQQTFQFNYLDRTQ